MRRIVRVRGRIILLILSITTIKNNNKKGVPIGTKWHKNSLVKLIILQLIIDNQIIKESGRTKDKWTVGVIMYIDRDKVLIKRNMNRVNIIIVLGSEILETRSLCSLDSKDKKIILTLSPIVLKRKLLEYIIIITENNKNHPSFRV